jgi:leucyl-tRNA synthetase
MLSDSPPDRDVIWTEAGVDGAWRFMQRLWRLVGEIAELGRPGPDGAGAPAAEAVRRAAHRALAAVEDDIEQLRFNRAVARIYELANALQAALPDAADPSVAAALRESAEILVQLVAPMMPHLAEECWHALGHETLLAEMPWPEADKRLLVEDTITLPVQVNGKKRAEIVVARDAGPETIESAALAHEAVRRAMEGRAPKRVIVVPQRIVNVVA